MTANKKGPAGPCPSRQRLCADAVQEFDDLISRDGVAVQCGFTRLLDLDAGSRWHLSIAHIVQRLRQQVARMALQLKVLHVRMQAFRELVTTNGIGRHNWNVRGVSNGDVRQAKGILLLQLGHHRCELGRFSQFLFFVLNARSFVFFGLGGQSVKRGDAFHQQLAVRTRIENLDVFVNHFVTPDTFNVECSSSSHDRTQPKKKPHQKACGAVYNIGIMKQRNHRYVAVTKNQPPRKNMNFTITVDHASHNARSAASMLMSALNGQLPPEDAPRIVTTWCRAAVASYRNDVQNQEMMALEARTGGQITRRKRVIKSFDKNEGPFLIAIDRGEPKPAVRHAEIVADWNHAQERLTTTTDEVSEAITLFDECPNSSSLELLAKRFSKFITAVEYESVRAMLVFTEEPDLYLLMEENGEDPSQIEWRTLDCEEAGAQV